MSQPSLAKDILIGLAAIAFIAGCFGAIVVVAFWGLLPWLFTHVSIRIV